MKSNIPPLQPDTFYHIYNRGINGENIFKTAENYDYFLRKYNNFIPPIAGTYAFCLLKNHFHFLIRTKPEDEIQQNFASKNKTSASLISLQFSHLFNGYTQGINKVFQRTGGLFETPFRRKAILDNSYLMKLIFYIHHNPEKHGMINDFKEYPHSSYLHFIQGNKSFVKTDEVLNWFGNMNSFTQFHSQLQNQSQGSIEL